MGSVASTSSSGFAIKLAPNFCGGGYFNVKTSSATTYSGGRPTVGYQTIVYGSGTCSTSIIASQVVGSAVASISLSGSVVTRIEGGFAMKSSGCGAINVYVNSSTSGAVPANGASATVTGKGSCSTYATATSIDGGSGGSTPTTISHVRTIDFLGTPWGSTSVPYATAAKYLTWAETAPVNGNAMHAAGLKTLTYVDPNRTTVGGPMFSNNQESAFAHTCSGTRVYDLWDNVTEYVMNPSSSSMRTLFQNYVNMQKSMGHLDAALEDTGGALSPYAVYAPFHASMPCSYSDAAWISGEIGMNQSVGLPVIMNGLSQLNGHNPSINIGALNGSNTVGGNFEGCYASTNQKKAGTWFWQATENTELQVLAKGKLFDCFLEDTTAASSSADGRLYGYASFLLTYDPNTAEIRTEYATPSRLKVMPETALVPLSPVDLAPAAISGLKTPGGTYARQFSKCYLKGNYVGPCAVVVNSDAVPHPFPYTTYHHSLAVSGSGVVDGGTVSVSGAAPPTTLPALEARIVFP